MNNNCTYSDLSWGQIWDMLIWALWYSSVYIR